MAYFDWTSKLETGIFTIDFQHRNLLNMINRLWEAGQELEGRETMVRVTLEQLLEYTVFHFETEEKMMDQSHFDHIEAHKVAHRDLAKKVTDLYERLDRGDDIFESLMTFLKKWLEHHIMVVDMQYVPSLKAAGLE